MEMPNTAGMIVGLPSSGRATVPEWGIALASISWPMNLRVAIASPIGMFVDEGRTYCAEQAIKHKARYLFFLDDDVTPPPYCARQLIYTMDQAPDDVMIVGGIYFSKGQPTNPVVFYEDGQGPYWRWKAGQSFRLGPEGSIGTGCMLIKTEVFSHLEGKPLWQGQHAKTGDLWTADTYAELREKCENPDVIGKLLEKPWFKTTDDIHIGPIGHAGGHGQTDDIYFCEKVRKAGFGIMGDGSVLCGHWDIKNRICYKMPENAFPMLDPDKQIMPEAEYKEKAWQALVP